MRERDRDDLVFVLPNHALHVDRDATEARIAARLFGAIAENRFDLIERHTGLDLVVAVLGQEVAAATDEKQ